MKYWITLTPRFVDTKLALKAKNVDYLVGTPDATTIVYMYPSTPGGVAVFHEVAEDIQTVLNKIEAAFKGD